MNSQTRGALGKVAAVALLSLALSTSPAVAAPDATITDDAGTPTAAASTSVVTITGPSRVAPESTATFTVQVRTNGAPAEGGTLALLANPDQASIFTCASVCSTMLGVGTPNANGQVVLTVPMTDAWFAAKNSPIVPSSGNPIHLGAMYTPPGATEPVRSSTTSVVVGAPEPTVTLDLASPITTANSSRAVNVALPVGAEGTLKLTCSGFSNCSGTTMSYPAVGTADVEPRNEGTTTVKGSIRVDFVSSNDLFSDTSALFSYDIKPTKVELAIGGMSTYTNGQYSIPAYILSGHRPATVEATIVAYPSQKVVQKQVPVDRASGSADVTWAGMGATTSYKVTVAYGGQVTFTSVVSREVSPLPNSHPVSIIDPNELPIGRTSVPSVVRLPPSSSVTSVMSGGVTNTSLVFTRTDTVSTVATTFQASWTFGDFPAPSNRTVGSRAVMRSATSVPCRPSGKSLVCDLGTMAPGAKISGRLNLPVTANMAGRTLAFNVTTRLANPDTGETMDLPATKVSVTAPKKTALAGKISTTKKSAKRGAKVTYSVAMSNIGRYATTGAQGCVSVPRTAKIVTAKGAKLNKARTQACWTVKKLAPAKGLTKKVVIRVPQKKGKLAVTWATKSTSKNTVHIKLTSLLPVS